MKTKNKIKLLGVASVIPAMVTPIAVLASCSCGDKKPDPEPETTPVFTYTGKKEINLRNQVKFELTFNCDRELTEDDELTATAENLSAHESEKITFEYEKDLSIKRYGNKAIFLATVENVQDGSYLEFNIKLSYSKGDLKSEQVFEGFSTDCQFFAGNITIVEGQENLLTQPQTGLQYYEFNLNDTHIPEGASLTAGTVVIDKTDNVKDVEFTLNHYIKDNKLYLCFEMIAKEGVSFTEGDSVEFKFSVSCTHDNQILWTSKFGEDEPFKLTYCNEAGVIPETEKVSKAADHDAGSDQQYLHLYVPSSCKTIKPDLTVTQPTNDYVITPIVADSAEWDDDKEFYYWPVAISFAKYNSKSLDDGDEIKYHLAADIHSGITIYPVDLGDFEFDYVSDRMNEPTAADKDQRTFMGSNTGRFYANLIDADFVEATDHLDLEVIPTSEAGIVPVRAHTTADRRGKEVWFEVKLTSPSLKPLESGDNATFNVRLTCSTKDGERRWREDFKEFRLTQFNNPLTFVDGQNKEQYIDFDSTKDTFEYTWRFKLDKGVKDTHLSSIKWDSRITSSSSPYIKIEFEQGEEGEGRILPLTVKISKDDGKPFYPDDYVKFAIQGTTDVTEWPWTYTEEGFMMYLWGGYYLSRNTTIRYSAKDYPQHALSCETVDDIPKGTKPGAKALVNVDTSVWNEEWPTKYDKWIFALPRDPEKGFGDGYWPVVSDKVQVVVTKQDGTKKTLTRTKTYADLEKTSDLFFVSDSGPITISKGTIVQGDKISYTVELAGTQATTATTRFYFTYHS